MEHRTLICGGSMDRKVWYGYRGLKLLAPIISPVPFTFYDPICLAVNTQYEEYELHYILFSYSAFEGSPVDRKYFYYFPVNPSASDRKPYENELISSSSQRQG